MYKRIDYAESSLPNGQVITAGILYIHKSVNVHSRHIICKLFRDSNVCFTKAEQGQLYARSVNLYFIFMRNYNRRKNWRY